MATVEDVLRIAEAEVGYSRWDDPEEGTKYGRWYAQITGSPYFGLSGVPYCAMWVSWVFAQANVQCEGFPRAVAIDRREGFKRAVEPVDAVRGDAIGFDWDSDATGDHVGIVQHKTGDYVTIRTVEGNTGNGEVLECVRHISQCTIAVRPYYEGSTSPAKVAGLLDVDGIAGNFTITDWQRDMGTYEDGVVSGCRPEHDKYRRNVWAIDREHEKSDLMVAIGEFLIEMGYDLGPDGADGVWGWWYSGAIQEFLKDKGYYTGEIDHDFAHHSVEGLQRSLNDGVWRR